MHHAREKGEENYHRDLRLGDSSIRSMMLASLHSSPQSLRVTCTAEAGWQLPGSRGLTEQPKDTLGPRRLSCQDGESEPHSKEASNKPSKGTFHTTPGLYSLNK
jgi:hypothetical protein